METYLGFSEIAWIAWEAIGTVSAVVITLIIILGSKVLNYLFSPNIKASKPEIFYEDISSMNSGRITLSWQIQNNSRLFLFGGMAVNVITRYWFDKKEHEGWTFSGNIRPIPILPKKEKWTQHTKRLDGKLEETEYILILVFYQTGLKDKDREYVIGHSKFTISWPPECARARARKV